MENMSLIKNINREIILNIFEGFMTFVTSSASIDFRNMFFKGIEIKISKKYSDEELIFQVQLIRPIT